MSESLFPPGSRVALIDSIRRSLVDLHYAARDLDYDAHGEPEHGAEIDRLFGYANWSLGNLATKLRRGERVESSAFEDAVEDVRALYGFVVAGHDEAGAEGPGAAAAANLFALGEHATLAILTGLARVAPPGPVASPARLPALARSADAS